MKFIKIISIFILFISTIVLFSGCDYFKSPFEQQIDMQHFAQENAQDMADQMMDNMQSFNQFMPNANIQSSETEVSTTENKPQ